MREATTKYRDWAATIMAASLIIRRPSQIGYEPSRIAKEAYALADALIAEAARDDEDEDA